METNQTVKEDIENIDIDIEIIDEDNDENVETVENEGKISNEYKENSWPENPEVPKGYTFKGKKRLFTFAVGKTKSALRKGTEKESA